jgi:predicted transcriptional regulator
VYFVEPLTFGDHLRDMRKHWGWTQEDLAREASVSVETVRSIERGRIKDPRVSTVMNLVAAVGHPFWDVKI